MMQNIHPAYFVMTGIAMTALAQIILKIGSALEIMKMKWVFYLALSVCCYAVSFVAYYLALRYFHISKIAPLMMAGTVVIVTIYGFFTGEPLGAPRILGIMLAILSLFFIYHS